MSETTMPVPAAPLAGLHDKPEIVARLREACETAGLTFPGMAASGAQSAWRFETMDGRPLFEERVLADVWNRAPYTLAFHLAETLAGGGYRVLRSARIGVRGKLDAIRAKLLQVAELLFLQALRGIHDEGGSRSAPAQSTSVSPATGGRARLAGGWLRYASSRVKASLYEETWTIGVAERSLEAIAASGEVGPVTWLKPPKGVSILADPFWWPGGDDMLCEELRPNHPGQIIVYKGDGKTLARGPLLMGGSGHLSYPCTFAFEGAVYVVPESIDDGATRIWRLRDDGALLEIATVAPGSRLADPTLFASGGLFWIFATDTAFGLHDNLCLYYSDRLEGPWRPHGANPVKIDIASARPAGAPFFTAGRLLRPAQDCAAGYGAAIALCEIEELTTNKFREQVVQRLFPDVNGPFPDGLHTLSAYGNRSLIDGKRRVARPYDLLIRLGRRAATGRLK